MKEIKPILAGSMNKYGFSQADNVWDTHGISPTIITGGSQIGHQINIMEKCELMGTLDSPKFNEMTSRVYGIKGISPAVRTYCGGYHEAKIGENMPKLRIRKLTEGECMRLMGFEEKDTLACKEKGLSKANIYHQSGDSICVTVLVGIFGELLGIDYQSKIQDHCDKLHEETL